MCDSKSGSNNWTHELKYLVLPPPTTMKPSCLQLIYPPIFFLSTKFHAQTCSALSVLIFWTCPDLTHWLGVGLTWGICWFDLPDLSVWLARFVGLTFEICLLSDKWSLRHLPWHNFLDSQNWKQDKSWESCPLYICNMWQVKQFGIKTKLLHGRICDTKHSQYELLMQKNAEILQFGKKSGNSAPSTCPRHLFMAPFKVL